MGMIVSVYRADRGDCSNGGISSKAKLLCVVNVDGPFDPSHDMPAVILVTNSLGNPVLRPARSDEPGKWTEETGLWFMFGGNYAATGDSRFNDAVRKYVPGFYGAIPIHDRTE